ncbi:MAG TPA: M48 family metalloprotease [Thermoplasmata archaeon]|nr:M48 family metalloprotease [Thermoplasmata archaeon]
MWSASPWWAFVPALTVLGGGLALVAAFRRSGSVTVFRLTVLLLAGWALLATTVLVWVVVGGGVGAALTLARTPTALLAPAAARDWVLGAAGAFVVFLLAFLLSQTVGRAMLIVLRPRPVDWPERLPIPATPTRLLAYASERADAVMFTLLVPSLRSKWSREDVILVSERLLAALSPTEWEAVVAHELGHLRELDGRYLTFFRTFSRMMRWDPVLAVMADALTRREEFQADQDAVELTGRPRALARAIYKASRLAPRRPRALAGLLGPGGSRGRRQATERIRRLVALAESGRFPEEPGA